MSNADNKYRPVIFSFFRKFQNVVLLIIFIIVVSSYGIYFVLQDTSEDKIRTSLFEDQSNKQIDSNKALSEHISSDLELLLTKLEVLSKSALIQNGNYSNFMLIQAMQDLYNNSKSLLGMTDLLFIANDEGIINSSFPSSEMLRESLFFNVDDKNDNIINKTTTTNNDINAGESSIVSQDYYKQVSEVKEPLFFSGQSAFSTNNSTSNNNAYRIIISDPIINEESGKFLGMVGLSLSTDDFFKRLGNVYDIKSPYISVLDANGTHLVHGNVNLVGKNFFDEYAQNFTQHNKDLNNLMRNVIAGKPGSAVYTISGLGERLTTGYPIFLTDTPEVAPTYEVFIVTPTSQIYSQIERLLFTERIETISLLAITTASIMILILFLIRWNKNLEKQISKRTNELVKSNTDLKDITKQLQNTNVSLKTSNKEVKETNEKLELRDKLQREFINIAAHELRTPTQAIMGYVEMALENNWYKDIDSEYGGYITSIERNANRLSYLIDNLLDVSRIENSKLELHKEKININDKIKNILLDYSNRFKEEDPPIQFTFSTQKDPIMVYVDRVRIYEVITNLLNNAVHSMKNTTIGKEAGSRGQGIGLIAVSVELSFYDKKSKGTDDNSVDDKSIGPKGIIEEVKASRYVIVSIIDSGSGIEANMFDKLFKKFYSFSGKGVGLGLFISKGIIEAHGGSIDAFNNKVGKGATFTFSLLLMENTD